MNRTSIEWTDWSCNPLKMRMPDGTLINACQKISPGCANFYAEGIVRRWWKKAWGKFPGYTAALLKIGAPVLVEEELEAVLRLNDRIAAGKADPAENKVFWNDMTDEFLSFWPDEFLDKLFAVRALTPHLIHQVLTKRPERMHAYCGDYYLYQRLHEAIKYRMGYDNPKRPAINSRDIPLHNVWLGVSVEDQQRKSRINILRHTPAAVRFLSLEPLLEDLGDIGLARPGADGHCTRCGLGFGPPHEEEGTHECPPGFGGMIDWCIVGGESGLNARPCDFDSIRRIVKQCKPAGVACFVKQVGSDPVYGIEPASARRYHPTIWGPVRDPKGGNPEEWPADLRVREYPAGKAVDA